MGSVHFAANRQASLHPGRMIVRFKGSGEAVGGISSSQFHLLSISAIHCLSPPRVELTDSLHATHARIMVHWHDSH